VAVDAGGCAVMLDSDIAVNGFEHGTARAAIGSPPVEQDLSLWQHNVVALRAERFATFAFAAGAVAVVGAGSPA
jgi:hypothetical protein